jgi:colicin import membrane protein
VSANTELAVVPPQETALAVYSAEKGLEPWLQVIRSKIDGFTPDISTRKGREAIASMAYAVARSKTALDDVGKKLVADLKEVPKKIDAERKRVRDTLEAWQEEVRRPLNEWQADEDARVDKHNDAIERIRLLAVDLDGITAEDLADRVAQLEAVALGDDWEEFESEAARAKDKALGVLRAALAARQQYEAEQAELVRLREEKEARDKKDNEDRIAREAAERATREAEEKAQRERDAEAQRVRNEQAAAEKRENDLKFQTAEAERRAEQAKREQLEAEQRAERDRLEAVERQKQAVEQARLDEKARADAAADEILRQERLREADKEHKKTICLAAQKALIAGGIDEEVAKAVIILIHQRKIPAISIQY